MAWDVKGKLGTFFIYSKCLFFHLYSSILLKRQEVAQILSWANFWLNEPFFCRFLLNKGVAWPFLRLKSFLKQDVEAVLITAIPNPLQNHEKYFLFCANCFQISNWVHNFYKFSGNAIFCPNRCLRTLSLCFSPVFFIKNWNFFRDFNYFKSVALFVN